MLASLLIAVGVIAGIFSALGFLGVVFAAQAVPLLVVAVVCLVVGYFLYGGHRGTPAI